MHVMAARTRRTIQLSILIWFIEKVGMMIDGIYFFSPFIASKIKTSIA